MTRLSLASAVENDLTTDEGFRALAYRDTAGLLTIGYGFNLDDPTAAGICTDNGLNHTALCTGAALTQAQARVLMAKAVDKAITDAASLVPGFWGLCDGAQRAFTNMAYNLGRTRLAQFSHLIRALEMNPPSYLWAAHEMQASVWYNQVKGRGQRLVQEMLLCAKGEPAAV